jgi:hypothetical protein
MAAGATWQLMGFRDVIERVAWRVWHSRAARTDVSTPRNIEQLLQAESRRTAAASRVCIGHSHVRTVAAAARRYQVPLSCIDFWTAGERIVVTADSARFHPDIADRLQGAVFSMIGGSAFNILALCVHPRRFDFVLPAAPSLPCDAQAELVPAAAVRTTLLQMTQKYLDLLGYVRDAATGAVYHIEAPPPFGEDWRRLPPDLMPFFTDKRREISPRWLRYKMWRLHSEINRQYCASRGITFIPHPPETVDAEGFLLPRFYADPMHANEAYGACILAQMTRCT